MTDVSETLQSLHACEREIDELSRARDDLPGAIEQAEANAHAAREVITDAKEKLEAAERKRRDKEAELQDTEALREKFQGQTSVVKTNEEYSALLREIEGAEQKISQVEEEILLAMETIEEVTAMLAETELEQSRKAEQFDRQAAELRDQLVSVERDLESHEVERERLAAGLGAQVQHSYEKLRRAKGSGTASVEGQSCSACHRAVPWEVVNRVKAGEILPCETCRRLLVVPVDA
jgi:predicted  nucleic acid-binding Zn-ribbon protein